ncbi:cysteine hydrolase family protein [Acidithiobacillus ferriphilus]|uniref:cysteine hydrolase family protein n=1 Tax=Acidithiobacillus ferriphilus TaxID=1689834 RepID=UPI003F510296
MGKFFDDALLLIVDVQKGFINKYTDSIPSRIASIIPKYRNIVATRFYNTDGSQYERLIGWSRLKKNTIEFDLAIDLPTDAIIIDKRNKYTCVNDKLKKIIREKSIKSVHLCGIDTSICVTKCATDLFENDIKPVVLADYCASTAGKEDHECALRILKRLIGKDQVVVAGDN